MISNADIAEYYDTTAIHYRRWWGLQRHGALHYGLWMPGIRSFGEALRQTNVEMAHAVNIQPTDKVLDAGCGVGGAARFLAKEYHATVTGITLSEQQCRAARAATGQAGLQHRVAFEQADFTATPFPGESFTVVWGCESVCHAASKAAFLAEAYRVLAPGGRLVVLDFFQAAAEQADPNEWLHKWGATWGVPHFAVAQQFAGQAGEVGFEAVAIKDYTSHIRKSAKRMWWASQLGAIPSRLYNCTHPKVSRYARTHYLCGLYQYRALKAGLWKYQLVTARKPT